MVGAPRCGSKQCPPRRKSRKQPLVLPPTPPAGLAACQAPHQKHEMPHGGRTCSLQSTAVSLGSPPSDGVGSDKNSEPFWPETHRGTQGPSFDVTHEEEHFMSLKAAFPRRGSSVLGKTPAGQIDASLTC